MTIQLPKTPDKKKRSDLEEECVSVPHVQVKEKIHVILVVFGYGDDGSKEVWMGIKVPCKKRNHKRMQYLTDVEGMYRVTPTTDVYPNTRIEYTFDRTTFVETTTYKMRGGRKTKTVDHVRMQTKEPLDARVLEVLAGKLADAPVRGDSESGGESEEGEEGGEGGGEGERERGGGGGERDGRGRSTSIESSSSSSPSYSPPTASTSSSSDFSKPLDVGIRVGFTKEGDHVEKDTYYEGHIIGIEIGTGTRSVFVGVDERTEFQGAGGIIELNASSPYQHIAYWLPGNETCIKRRLMECALKPSARQITASIKKAQKEKNGSSMLLRRMNEALRKGVDPAYHFLLEDFGGQTGEAVIGGRAMRRTRRSRPIQLDEEEEEEE